MIYKIENEFISAEINSFGAELHSFKSKSTDIEYLWQGNPVVWYGQSPILFPIIGQLLDSKFTYRGKEYTLPKHGFARKRSFILKSIDETSAVFSLSDDEETLKIYPFMFELLVCFKLTNYVLEVSHTVINKNNDDMYFSIGAHPGFNCEMGDFLEFSENETLKTERIDNNAILTDEKFTLLDNDNKIIITPDIFINDALFLSDLKSSQITLKSPRHNRELRFTFGTAPFLGIWAKPAAPYVCIEPWYGINDSYCRKNDISEKRGIQYLKANESFQFSWSAEIWE